MRRCFVIAEIGINHEGDVTTCARLDRSCRPGRCRRDETANCRRAMRATRGARKAMPCSRAPRCRAKRPRKCSRWRGSSASRHLRPPAIGANDRLAAQARSCRATRSRPACSPTTPLVEHAARQGLPLLLSTGMGEIADIDRAESGRANGWLSRTRTDAVHLDLSSAGRGAQSGQTIRSLERRFEVCRLDFRTIAWASRRRPWRSRPVRLWSKSTSRSIRTGQASIIGFRCSPMNSRRNGRKPSGMPKRCWAIPK